MADVTKIRNERGFSKQKVILSGNTYSLYSQQPGTELKICLIQKKRKEIRGGWEGLAVFAKAQDPSSSPHPVRNSHGFERVSRKPLEDLVHAHMHMHIHM